MRQRDDCAVDSPAAYLMETAVQNSINDVVWSKVGIPCSSKANLHEIEKFVEKIQPNSSSFDYIRAVFDAVRSLGQGTGV